MPILTHEGDVTGSGCSVSHFAFRLKANRQESRSKVIVVTAIKFF